MGMCTSCESTGTSTAKLILDDGRLQEFPYPVKVSYVLQKNPACFICNSDEMDFNDIVSPVRDDEELQPGQIYFALPLNRLKCRLRAEEMAELAVKASSALTNGGCCRDINLVFSSESGLKQPPKVVAGGETGLRWKKSGGGGCGGRRRGKFKAKLSTISE